MQGYLVTPSDYPVARVKYEYVPHPQTVTPFIPRQTYDLWLPASAAADGPAASERRSTALPSPPSPTEKSGTDPSRSPSPNPSDAPTATAEHSPTNPVSAGPDVDPAAPSTSRSVAQPANVISLSTGEIVDGDTGEVHGTSASREPGAGERPTGRAGLGDLLG
jgi:hypothetical protein